RAGRDERGVAPGGRDELHADRCAAAAGGARHGQRGDAEERPRTAEEGVARDPVVEPRRLAADRGHEERLTRLEVLGEERAALGAERDGVPGDGAADRVAALEERARDVA